VTFEHLPSDSKRWLFLQLEAPRQPHVEIVVTREKNTSRTHIPDGFPERDLQRRPLLNQKPKRAGRVVADRSTPKYWAGWLPTFVPFRAKSLLLAARNVGIVSRPDPVDRRQAPAGRRTTEHVVGELRHFEHRGEVEHLADIGKTVPLAMIAVANERIGNGRIRPRIAGLIALERSNAVGPMCSCR